MCLLVSSVFASASAQTFPSKPIRLVIPTPPGGGSDILGRILAQKLYEKWGQPVVVDDRPGGNGVVGTDIVAKSAPDGYTLLVITGIHAALPLLQKLPYDSVQDFAPVGRIGSTPLILTVNSQTPVHTVNELVAFAKANNAKASFGSAGSGSPSHLAGETFNRLAGMDAIHVPYKGAGQAIIDLLSNSILFAFNNSLSAMPLLAENKLRALAVSSAKRAAVLPQIPTMIEAGYPDFDIVGWFGVLAPAKTPPEVIAKLNDAIHEAIKSPEVVKQFENTGVEPTPDTPSEFANTIKSEMERWIKVKEAGGIRSE
jgi:tripartite-type tricarboxylate transporter receptor subunit TctC